MQEIHVKRYAVAKPTGESRPYVGTIEPEDRSWILFVREGAPPELWLAADRTTEDGKIERCFVPAGAVADTPQG